MPDINVWLALSWGSHPHCTAAWKWFSSLAGDEVLYCRFTQIGLLRLLTTKAVMGDDCRTVKQAWGVYDSWLGDPKVAFRYEPAEVEGLYRHATARLSNVSAPKALGDCYLVALSRGSPATVVTLDGGLSDLAGKFGQEAVLLK